MNYSNNSNGKILLIGDFNSRTGSLSDFIEPHIDDHMLSHSLAPSITSKRKSFDGSTNKHGKRLIKLCKSKQLSILNRRKEGDTLKMFTFISNKGEASTIDNSIVSESLFHNIPYFIVNPHNYLSNHSQISLCIRSDDYSLKPQSDNHGDSLIDSPKSFVFKNHSKIEFQVALCSGSIQTKITKFNEIIFPSDQAGVNQANNLLSEIFMSAGEKSFHNTKGKFRRKTKNVKKKWFNGECDSARKLVLLASKNKHRDLSNPTIQRSYNKNLKHF